MNMRDEIPRLLHTPAPPQFIDCFLMQMSSNSAICSLDKTYLQPINGVGKMIWASAYIATGKQYNG